MGGGRKKSGESSEVHERPSVTSTAPKARSRSRGVATLDEAQRMSLNVIQITDIDTVVVGFSHHRARTDIGMPIYEGSIRANIGFLVHTVKARGGTASRGTRRGAVIRCFTLHRQVVTTA